MLLGPLGELEADEAVVGLMALHVLRGERPVFYWGQPYLGSLEAFVAAPALALFGPSAVALKAVAGLWSLAFVALAYLTARRVFGPGPALLAALYLALPPAFLAVWSLKARGGYVSVLALGQLLFYLAVVLGESAAGAGPAAPRDGSGAPRRSLALGVGLFGLVAGLSFWTNLLAVAFIGSALAYLLLRLRGRLLGAPLAALVAGLLLGAAPLVHFNLTTGFASWQGLRADEPYTFEQRRDNLGELVRVGGPVLVGLAQGSSSIDLFAADWAARPARWWGTKYAIMALVALAVAAHGRSFAALLGGRPAGASGPALYLLLLLGTPLLISLTRLGELVTEPRYALPLYAAVPLYAALAWRLVSPGGAPAERLGVAVGPAPRAARRAGPRKVLFAALLAVAFGLNAYSLLTADPRLNLPTSAGASSAATRRALADFLLANGLTHVYTDYWLAYPLAFESGERIVPSVTSGGFNRSIPYAHAVSVHDRPAFVFVSGLEPEREFRAKLAQEGARASVAQVSIYTVFWDVEPLSPFRP